MAIVDDLPEFLEPLGVMARLFFFDAERAFEPFDLELFGERRRQDVEIAYIGFAERFERRIGRCEC